MAVTIKITGGKLYQWDTGRVLEVTGAADAVEYSVNHDGLALRVAIKNGRAEIPNVLMQSNGTLRIWIVATEDGRQTLSYTSEPIIARAKPQDYVYTETEIMDYRTVAEELRELAQRVDELVENGISAGGAVESVNGKIGKVVLTAADVGALPKDNPGTIKSTGVLIAGEGSTHTARMEGGEGRAMFSMRDSAGNIINRISLRENETTLGVPLAVGSGGHGGKNAAEGRANLGAVSKDGDTMTGKLTVPELVVEATGGKNPGLQFASTALGKVFSQIKASASTLKMYIQNFSPSGTGSEIFNLPVPDSGLTSDKHYDLLTTKKAVTIPEGGTGAKDAPGMRKNFDLYSKAEVDTELSKLSEEIANLPAPYTLPTASPTVKGGVMIGDGLEMDGEKVRVREGEYELIETITLKEDAIIDKSKEPDGTPYNFRAILVSAIKPAEINFPEVSAFTTFSDGTALNTYLQECKLTTEQHQTIEVENRYGTWLFTRSQWSLLTAPSNIATNKAMSIRMPVNKAVICRWNSTKPFPAGATILIYGVRV